MSDSTGDLINQLEFISYNPPICPPEDLPEILKKFLGDVSKKSVYQQIGFGGVSGLSVFLLRYIRYLKVHLELRVRYLAELVN